MLIKAVLYIELSSPHWDLPVGHVFIMTPGWYLVGPCITCC